MKLKAISLASSGNTLLDTRSIGLAVVLMPYYRIVLITKLLVERAQSELGNGA